jgi:hypothetical protein
MDRCSYLVRGTDAYTSCFRLNAAVEEDREERRQRRLNDALGSLGDDLQAQGNAMLNRPRSTALSAPSMPSPEMAPGLAPDLYSVQHGEVRLFAPTTPSRLLQNRLLQRNRPVAVIAQHPM